MKSQVILTATATLIGFAVSPSANADLLVSNLDESLYNRDERALFQRAIPNPDLYVAHSFTTGANAAIVTGATALLGNWRDPASSTAIYEASIWTNSPGLPGSQVATFDNNPTLPGSTTQNVYVEVGFASTGVTLAANTTYWFAIRNTENDGPHALIWAGTDNDGETSPVGWTIGDGSYATTADDPPSFELDTDTYSLKFELTGTSVSPIPEPSSLLTLGGIMAAGLVTRRRHRNV